MSTYDTKFFVHDMIHIIRYWQLCINLLVAFFLFFLFFLGRGAGGLVCWAWTFSVFFFPLLGHVRLFHFFFIIYFCFPRREILFYLFSFFLFIFWGLTRRVFFLKISRHDISFLINLSDCLFFFFCGYLILCFNWVYFLNKSI